MDQVNDGKKELNEAIELLRANVRIMVERDRRRQRVETLANVCIIVVTAVLMGAMVKHVNAKEIADNRAYFEALR